VADSPQAQASNTGAVAFQPAVFALKQRYF